MTTKPKARKFRIRRNTPRTDGPAATGGSASSSSQDPADVLPPEYPPQHPGPEPDTPAQPQPRAGQVSSAAEMSASQNIDDIRNEGLTGRQLRMARRMAQKHGLAPTSDFDAIRLLRSRGIDPFQRSNILELVAEGSAKQPPEGGEVERTRVQLPQTVPAPQNTLPSTDLSPADRRAQEIMKIQRDIAKRRRRKMMMLLSRLAAFVMLPTLVVGYYYSFIATPMYTTKSAFLILSSEGSGGGGGALRGLLPSQFATGQDAIATQEYLQSKAAMLRLDSDVGFRAHFSQDWIDPIQRLDASASNEKAYKIFQKYVKLGYDPTEGVIRMEVSTADPSISTEFSQKLIAYAEENVDQLSQRLRFDSVQTAITSLEQAKKDRRDAQVRLVEMQESSIIDPVGEIASIRGLINSLELQLQEKQLALNIQLNNARPNRSKVAALSSEIEVLNDELIKQNDRLNHANEGSASLASQSADIQLAQADLATADLALQEAFASKRMSEVEANKQVRYLTVSVKPVASQDPSFPKAFENTILAFLIFGGIYLMISLTASILREQVTT